MFKICKYTVSIPLTWLLMTTSALAEEITAITADTNVNSNLGTQVTSNNDTKTDNITGGTIQGNNLFHSFSQFSVLNGRTAYFDFKDTVNIENIFTRVTGDSLSNIDGIIRAKGTANLFLLNPHGIIFTENARLDIGGSFIGSTANSIKFSDGTEFSATNPQTQPLLSVNLPTALQFTSNPSAITVKGQGHERITTQTDPLKGAVEEIKADGLQVHTGKTLALIGGNINLEGGNLIAKEGKVELGSIQSPAKVTFDIDKNWTFDYKDVATFSDITLTRAAVINTTSTKAGDVVLQGQNIYFKEGSAIVANTNGSENAGNVKIKVTGLLELSGKSDKPTPKPSIILAETTGEGNAGTITADAANLELKDGAQLSSASFSAGNGGDITVKSKVIILSGESTKITSAAKKTGNSGNIEINTNELTIQDSAGISVETSEKKEDSVDGGKITIQGLDQLPSETIKIANKGILSSITNETRNAGDITIKTRNLTLETDSQIQSGTTDFGNGGNITINTNQLIINKAVITATSSGIGTVEPKVNGGTITIQGLNPETKSELIKISHRGTLSNNTTGTGNAGGITIKTRNLTLETGAQIQSLTIGNSGDGGIININSDSVLLTDKTDRSSGILASSINLSTGKGGSIKIDTNTLDIKKDAQIGVGNFRSADPNGTDPKTVGTGAPGNITITANSLNLDNGQIVAKAYLANGGNINLTVNDISTLNHGIISATAGNAQNPGNGGNIEFNSPFIIASRASEITAEAYKGDGGNLTFDSQGLFFTPDTIIDASSKLGADGTIEIKTVDTNPVEGLIERQNFVYPKQLAVGCNDQVGIAEGSLTYIGKGGIAPLSTDDFSSDTVLDDLRPVPTNNIDENIAVTIPPEKPAYKPIREAQGWRWKDEKKDTVIFISNPIENNQQSSSSNPILCRDLKNHPS